MPSVEEELRKYEEYHTQMGRGSLKIEDALDLGQFDLSWHFRECGPGGYERLMPILNETLKGWAAGYRAEKEQEEVSPEQRSLLASLDKEFVKTNYSQVFLKQLGDGISIKQLFDPKRSNTLTDYAVRCLSVVALLRDEVVLKGAFESTRDKYLYMSHVKVAVDQIFTDKKLPGLKYLHL